MQNATIEEHLLQPSAVHLVASAHRTLPEEISIRCCTVDSLSILSKFLPSQDRLGCPWCASISAGHRCDCIYVVHAGERLVEELCPELAPMLASIEMPANFVPMTNAVLSEMARRGVSRDRILATLRRMGGELPLDSLRLLQWAGRAGIDVRILSDCNTLFIGHILTGEFCLVSLSSAQSAETRECLTVCRS